MKNLLLATSLLGLGCYGTVIDRRAVPQLYYCFSSHKAMSRENHKTKKSYMLSVPSLVIVFLPATQYL